MGKTRPFRRKILTYLIVLVVCSIALLSIGFYFYVMRDIPSVKVLKRLENKPVSSIYGINGELVYLIVPDNRIFVDYNKIPQYVKDAFLAAEDAEFFKHGAIDASLFHSGTLSTQSPGISTIAPEAALELSREDATALGIKNGDLVTVTSQRGSIAVKARVTAKQSAGTVFVPYHFARPAVHELTGAAEPYALVKIEKQN